MTSGHVYMNAPVNKVFDATAILQLVEKGLIDPDTDVGEYVPFEVRHPGHPAAPITARMLLAQGVGSFNNIGWINFSPSTAGVFIDPATGQFSGHAWGENIGWIAFAWSGSQTGQLTTAWRCDPPPTPPVDSPELTVEKNGADAALHWNVIAGAGCP